jgi:SNF2 family DNA or RNA helicase
MEADQALWPLSLEPRPYQTEALGRMVERGNQLLALTMGAGKTLTGVAAVEHLSSTGQVQTGFVFCPNSIKFQWLSEIRRHTGAAAQVIDGSRDERRYQYKWARKHRYNVANYDTLRNDVDMVRNIYGQPDYVIADEATQIKSLKSKRSRILKGWTRDVPYRFALTGQPIENRPEELFSIMEFVDRGVLGQFMKFDRTFILRDHFGRPTRYRNMDVLKQAMQPVMFRRSRSDIEAYLPKINRLELPVLLSPQVMNLYRFIAADTLVAIQQLIESGSGGWNILQAYGRAEGEEGGRGKGEVMSRLTCMRLLCDNPFLLVRSAKDFDDTESSTGSKYASWLLREGWLDGLADTTKMDTAADLIEEIMDEDPANRVVLFAYFKPMLRMLAQALRERKIMSTMLTGDMNAQARQRSLEHFRTDTRVLLSSDAGQYGVDLPQANYLISYDLPWSAGAFAQRVARIDRTSSLFGHINVITMMAAHTIEVRQYEMLRQKAMVAEAWLDAQHIDAKGGLTLTLGTLKEFLEAA